MNLLPTPRKGLATLWLLGACGLTGGCPDENLQNTHAKVEVCPAEGSPSDQCNRPFDLGEFPLTSTRDLMVFVFNRGDNTLQVMGVVPEDPASAMVTQPPGDVTVNGSAPLSIRLTSNTLGVVQTALDLQSNDQDQPHLPIKLQWTGTPRPVPHIELCTDVNQPGTCGVDVTLAFGQVRRSQRESRTVVVRNSGTAPLQITAVTTTGASSLSGEIDVGTSTRPGFLPPGGSAPVVVLYEPLDGMADQVALVFSSDDVDHPTATLTVTGSSVDNLPPTADARVAGGMLTLADVTVGDSVTLDGMGSGDPEGDPLTFLWTLRAPATSSASLDDPAAGRVTFAPDRAGSFRVELLVTDSLGQVSSPVAQVLVRARPRYVLRVALDWQQGGDVDLHVVQPGGMPFSSGDCYFQQPRPDFGVAGDPLDDPSLLSDSQAAPGHEEVVIAEPVDGTYDIYAHYFEGSAPAVVDASVMFNDSGAYALQTTQALPAMCMLWHVGSVNFPSQTATAAATAPTQMCR